MSAMTQSRQRGKEKRREATKTPKTDEVIRCEQCNMEMQANPPFAPSSWLRIVYEAIKRLHNEANPHRKYFHYKHDICSYIDKNWYSLCPEKKKTSTWNNTVSAVITTHRKLFKSNRKQSGYWTLRSAAQAMDIEDLKEVVKKSPKKRTHTEMVASSPVTPKVTKPRGLTEEEVYQLKTSVSPSQPRVFYAISLRRKNKPGSEDDLGSPSRRTRSATGGDENEDDDDPMLLDDALIQIPVPKPWMDRVIKHPLVADTYTIEGPIPIPRWVEVNEDEVLDEDDSPGPSPSKKAKISSPKSDGKEKVEEDGDEDISDARFSALHQPYETLEKRLQKYFVNSQNNGVATVNNTNH
jgi:hypothetical protein